jgi:homoserine dehydrogenase
MKTIKVALLGLGTVGTGVYETVYSHQLKLREATGLPVEIVGVLVKNAEKPRSINQKIIVTTKVEDLLAIQDLDVVFEAIVGIEPANTYIRSFLEKGCHVISANKELLAHKGKELKKLASTHKRFLTFEAAVAGGVPLLRTIIQLLQVNGIVKLEAILNGTSNYILTRMRKEHALYQDVLKDAQELGYAEADPSNDILGTDAFYKLMILSDLIYQQQPKWEDVEKIGINHVSTNDLLLGERLGLRLKLVATLESKDNTLNAEVRPVFVDAGHPLYNVEGVDNGIVITTDLVGSILLQGPGAGSKATASAMIEDLVFIQQQGIPTDDRPRLSYRGEIAENKEQSSWLVITDAKTSETLQNNYSVTSKLANYGIELLKREMIKTDNGYVVGDLLIGKEANILQYVKKLNQELLRFYPVSATGFEVNQESEKPVLQSTTL